MGQKLGIVLVGLTVLMGSQPVRAMVQYDDKGKVSLEGVYQGPGLTAADLPWLGGGLLGATIALGGVFSEPAAMTILPAAIIGWGVTRTRRYRPAAVAQRIHAALAEQATKPRPGTTAEVLGWRTGDAP